MQQVSGRGEQGTAGHIQCLPPPGVRAQPCHHPAVVLQREGDDAPIKRVLLIGATESQGEALIPAQINYTRPGGGETNTPVHCPSAADPMRRPAASPSAGVSVRLPPNPPDGGPRRGVLSHPSAAASCSCAPPV